MVAEYLDKNYDRVRLLPLPSRLYLHTYSLPLFHIINTVLRLLHNPHPLHELRHQTAVAQASGGDPPRSGEF